MEPSAALACFKAYDIRGRVPGELNDTLVQLIGTAFAHTIGCKNVVLGRDVRHSSEGFHHILTHALLNAGVDVYDVGMCATEEVYFATFHHSMDAGIMVTASHNPLEFNGMKMVKGGAAPLDDADFAALKTHVQQALQQKQNNTAAATQKLFGAKPEKPQTHTTGRYHRLEHTRAAYVQHLLSYVDTKALQPLKIVVNAGNGPAGLYIDLLEQELPFTFIKINHQPNPSFPHGIPNPVLVEQRQITADAVRKHQADLGIAWDGDADRCCLFDAHGTYINAYYIVGLLAQALLQNHPGATVVSEPRLYWNTLDVAQQNGAKVVASRVGHGYIKSKMREADALFGGEASGHYFFRDFASCDSGMIPWLLVTALISGRRQSLQQLVEERYALFPASDEINHHLDNTGGASGTLLTRVEALLKPQGATRVDYLDGLTMEFADWRFNLRQSKNEPWLVRLNVETRGNEQLMHTKRDELLQTINTLTQAHTA